MSIESGLSSISNLERLVQQFVSLHGVLSGLGSLEFLIALGVDLILQAVVGRTDFTQSGADGVRRRVVVQVHAYQTRD